MLEITEIPISLNQGSTEEGCLEAGRQEAARLLGCQPFDIDRIELSHRSVDARRKQHVQIIISIRVTLREGLDERAVMTGLSVQTLRRVKRVEERPASFPAPVGVGERQMVRPVVVGAGSAGLFATLALAEAGLEPLLIERGDEVEARRELVQRFSETGELDPDSNVQFGIGGAGTFSDGKLVGGSRNPDHRLILETLVQAGAPRDILWEAEPHIGSDLLPGVMENLVARIREAGGEVRFRTKLIDIARAGDGSIRNIVIATEGREESILANRLILACGRSARDVYEILQRIEVELSPKTFGVGVRIEHLQVAIDRARYGAQAGSPALGAASYRLVTRCANGRSLYTSGMCPGGEVVAAATEAGGVVTDGTSLRARTGRNAGAALLVKVSPHDLASDDPLAGMELQRSCEQRAFELGGGAYRAPAQLLGDFLSRSASTGAGRVVPTYPRGVTWCALDDAMPAYVAETIRQGIPALDRKLPGYGEAEAVLTGVETRADSPVTIVRDKNCQAKGTPGLYPCGEGAGYAGGIMGSAADGLACARALIDNLPSYLKLRS